MTTQSVYNNSSSQVEKTTKKIAEKKAMLEKDSAIRKDRVEISGQNKTSGNKEITYSPESIMNTKISPQTFDYGPQVHDLEQIKQKISSGYYENNNVTSTVVNRLFDNIK